MKKRLSLNTQLKALQQSINNIRMLIENSNRPESQDAKNAFCDFQQIIYSLRDMRYKLAGTAYEPVRQEQVTKYTIKDVRDLLSTYSSCDYLDAHVKRMCREECIRLVTVDEYFNQQPLKYTFTPAYFTEIVERYKKVIVDNNLPTVSLSMYKFICESLRKEGYGVVDAQNYEPQSSAATNSEQNDDLF